MIHVVLVDDEESGRETLRELIIQYCPELKIDYIASSVQEGITAINSHNPDLVFLDIEMPLQNGFDLLQNISEIDFEVIFVTAHDQYAVQAFRYSAIDYLLKPIVVDDLRMAIEKVVKKIATGKPDKKHFEALFSNLKSPNHQPVKIAIPDATGYVFIELSKIIRIEGASNISYLFVEQGTKVVVSRILKDFEDLLTEEFLRVHKSHIVNLKHVQKYIKGDGGILVMDDGTEIDVSRKKKNELLEKMRFS